MKPLVVVADGERRISAAQPLFPRFAEANWALIRRSTCSASCLPVHFRRLCGLAFVPRPEHPHKDHMANLLIEPGEYVIAGYRYKEVFEFHDGKGG